MSLKYPLHKYDEGGRLRPPRCFYFFMLFVCRALLILIISLSFREDSERLLRLFYPEPYHFYLALIPVLPAFLAMSLVSYRNTIWAAERHYLFRMLRSLMYLALLSDLTIQMYMLWRIDFMFSMAHGLSIIICIIGIFYVSRSRYLSFAAKDWRAP